MRKFTAWLLALMMIFSLQLVLGEETRTADLTPLMMPADNPAEDDTAALLAGGHVPDPACYTEDGYEDDSISVKLEKIWVDDALFNVARVRITDPSQLRTGVEAIKKKDNYVATIAKRYHAVIATGADYFRKESRGVIIRMGHAFSTKGNTKYDMLVTDQNGDLHIALRSDTEELKKLKEEGVEFINTFCFGPALIKDGELLELPEKYNFNLKGKEPRCGFGQTGPLEYLMVVVDGRKHGGSAGCSVETLAKFMHEQGCVTAFNFDGGNTATMVFQNDNWCEKTLKADRPQSDILYFATLVDAGLDGTEE